MRRTTLLLALWAMAVSGQQLDLVQIAALPGEPGVLSAGGVTRSGARLVTIENGTPFTSDPRKRLVIVADNERAGQATLEGIRWFKATAPSGLRGRWSVSALLLSHANDATPAQQLLFPPLKGFFDHPDQPEAPYTWRWVIYQAPDFVLQVRGGDALTRGDGPAGSISFVLSRQGSGLGTAPAVFSLARESDGATLMRQVLTAESQTPRSPIRVAIDTRTSREPLAIARLLAKRYPQNATVSYIPSVAWTSILRLADVTKDDTLRQKVLQQTRPWLSKEQALFGERLALTTVAGTMIFADLAERGEQSAQNLANQGAEAASRSDAATGFAQYGQGWTDDMFMSAAILSRTGRTSGRNRDLDRLADMLISYARRLQREDGLFVHFSEGRVPWGRGNGFAALGVMEALSALPPAHPSRAELLAIYRRHMAALKNAQAPDGMWRQVVDEPGSYREESVTAMTLTAMARGLRLGWLDRTYRPAIERAWLALAAHVTEDGGIVDVCASTGSGPSLRFYLDRPAVSGFDDRGGAMALLAAMEMHDLSIPRR